VLGTCDSLFEFDAALRKGKWGGGGGGM